MLSGDRLVLQMCDFKSEAGEPCSHAVSNRKNVNSCVKHPDSPLKGTGPCDGYFVYVPIQTAMKGSLGFYTKERIQFQLSTHILFQLHQSWAVW